MRNEGTSRLSCHFFVGKAPYFYNAFLHLGVQMGTEKFNAEGVALQ